MLDDKTVILVLIVFVTCIFPNKLAEVRFSHKKNK